MNKQADDQSPLGYRNSVGHFSVCGWLCGQRQTARFQVGDKVRKCRKTPEFLRKTAASCALIMLA